MYSINQIGRSLHFIFTHISSMDIKCRLILVIKILLGYINKVQIFFQTPHLTNIIEIVIFLNIV